MLTELEIMPSYFETHKEFFHHKSRTFKPTPKFAPIQNARSQNYDNFKYYSKIMS